MYRLDGNQAAARDLARLFLFSLGFEWFSDVRPKPTACSADLLGMHSSDMIINLVQGGKRSVR